jgi:16S rRNA U516 pseudouridylate synthase RsuA-like enzyme
MQRLAKAISNSGICSRRQAEKLILAGEVKLDGEIIISPAINVSDQNIIEVSGKIININQNPRLWVYYKPLGLITTHKDTHGRETVFDNLPNLPRVISIGRLDLNSEGLLLLTNNGDLARKFELPSSKLERVYKVRAYGDHRNIISYCERQPVIASLVKQSQEATTNAAQDCHILPKDPSDNDRVYNLKRLGVRSDEIATLSSGKLAMTGLSYDYGIIIDKISYNPKSIKLVKAGTTNSWFEVVLTEGKNREIRKIFEYFGLKVNRLIRLQYGSFLLGSLKPGEYKEQNFHTFKDLC